jgi:hypothetical protein
MFSRTSRTRSIVVAAALVSLSSGTAADAKQRVLSETSRELGFGFREVTRSVENPPGVFEGVGHFGFLYFREQELGQHGTYSISPSGRYVVYQDGPSGDIVLFAAASRKARVVQKYPGALVVDFTWGKKEMEVMVAVEPIRVTVE